MGHTKQPFVWKWYVFLQKTGRKIGNKTLICGVSGWQADHLCFGLIRPTFQRLYFSVAKKNTNVSNAVKNFFLVGSKLITQYFYVFML